MAMKGKGGAWTERKLKALREYMTAFNTALRNKPSESSPFERVYIDAFAGTGDRELPELPLLDNDPDIANIAKGSARIALECELGFDRFVLIDKNRRHAEDLKKLAAEFGDKDVQVCRADANEKLIKICASWKKREWRGVLFIDPYGCQVEWSTLEAVAATESIDVWLLFPVNAVRRMLVNDPAKFEPEWIERLNLLFGTDAWFEHFYPARAASPDLFGSAGVELGREVSLEGIEDYYRSRLESIFRGGVSGRAIRLGPQSRDPLFSLFFASGNPSPRAKNLAFRIANHLIKKWDV